MSPRVLLLAWLVLCSLSLARADTVILTNGNEFEGEIQEDSPKRVVIKVRGGVMTFPRRLVEKVVKSAPKKKQKKPKKRQAAAGKIDPGGPSYWTENRAYAKAGEVWHFKYTPTHEPKAGTPLEASTPKSGRLRVERVGLFGIRYGRSIQYRGRAQPNEHWEGFFFNSAGVFPRTSGEDLGDWRKDALEAVSPERQRYLKELAKSPSRTLTLAGREFPCKLVTMVKPRRKKRGASRVGRWSYIHFAKGEIRWPGLLKEQRGKKVLQVLTKIDPPPADRALPPVRPWAKPGDQVTVLRLGKQVTRVVTRVCPTSVEMKCEDGSLLKVWRFSPIPLVKRIHSRWRVSERRRVTVSGKSFLCQEFVAKANPAAKRLVRVSKGGLELWPGEIEDTGTSSAFEKVVEIRSSR